MAFSCGPVLVTMFVTVAWPLGDHRFWFAGPGPIGWHCCQLCPSVLPRSVSHGHSHICVFWAAMLEAGGPSPTGPSPPVFPSWWSCCFFHRTSGAGLHPHFRSTFQCTWHEKYPPFNPGLHRPWHDPHVSELAKFSQRIQSHCPGHAPWDMLSWSGIIDGIVLRI